MHNLLSGVLLGPADLLDNYAMKNAFEYEEELAELQATIAKLEKKLNNAINLDFERRAEIERLNKQLCICPSCCGQGEIYSGHDSCQGQWQPPEPDMDKCGECDGDGVIGTPIDLATAIAEIERLKGGQGEPVAYRYKEGRAAWENEKPWEPTTLGHGAVLLGRKERAASGEFKGDSQAYYLALTVDPLYTSQPAPVSVALPSLSELRALVTEAARDSDIIPGANHYTAAELAANYLLSKVKELNTTRPSHANAPADSGTHPHNDGLDDYRGKV
jgi:hypothetical protein